jgi:single-stranded-DNA-specific exonuclease
MGNPAPVFGVQGVRLAGRKRVGNGHLKGTLTDGATRLDVIGFSWADRVGSLEDGPVDIAFRLETNEWQGRVSLQARVVSLLPPA